MCCVQLLDDEEKKKEPLLELDEYYFNNGRSFQAPGNDTSMWKIGSSKERKDP